MARPLMPKATAMWLMHNTRLTKAQIGAFCDLHPLAIEVLASQQMYQLFDPVAAGQLTREEIQRCEADPAAHLSLHSTRAETKKKAKPYTPLSKRAEVPHVVLWFIKNHPHISDNKISHVLPTTVSTIKAIRDGSHWKSKQLVPKDPVLSGLMSQEALDEVLAVDNAKDMS